MTTPERSETPAEKTPAETGRLTRWLLWTGVALLLCGSFAISLAANVPARWMVEKFNLALSEDAVSGTPMHGQIVLDGGQVLSWQIRPLASLFGLRIAADVALRGAGADLASPVTVGFSSYQIGPVNGGADADVLAKIFPDMKLRCTGPLLFTDLRLGITRQTMTGDGIVRSGTLICQGGTQTAEVPAMNLGFTAFQAGTVTGVTAGALPVLTATAAGDGRLSVVLHKAGAALFPGLPASADTSIDVPLSTFFR